MKMPQSQANVGSSFKRSESGLAKRSDVRRVMCRNRETANKMSRTVFIMLLTVLRSSFSCCCFGFDGGVRFIQFPTGDYAPRGHDRHCHCALNSRRRNNFSKRRIRLGGSDVGSLACGALRRWDQWDFGESSVLFIEVGGGYFADCADTFRTRSMLLVCARPQIKAMR